jgi:tRNA(Ile)-lysidine synthase
MSANINLITKMKAAIRRFNMIEPKDTVLAGVSGGPDSVALLYALYECRDELAITLHIAHLNHSFRGEESDRDAEYVRTLAERLNIPATIEKIDVPKIRRTLRLSAEEAARIVRHDFLNRTADRIRADRIALAHTADDVAETVLLNLTRGTGVDGLAGIPPVRDRIIRPLIHARRDDVERYVSEHHLSPRTDSTNLIPEYRRNRVRLELLPLLRKDFNADIDAALIRLAELAMEDSAYLNTEAESALSKIRAESKPDGTVIKADELATLPPAIARRVAREAIRQARGELTDVGFVHIAELLRLLSSGRDFHLDMPGVHAERAARFLTIYTGVREDMAVQYDYAVAVPGKTDITEADAVIVAETGSGPGEFTLERGSLAAVLDA